MKRSRIKTDPDSVREWQERSMKKLRGVKRTSKPLPAVNRKRRAKLTARQFGDHAEYIRSLPCVIRGMDAGECGPSEAAHVRSRGAGGTAADLVPLCLRHHAEQHVTGIETFQERYEIDLRAIAADLWASRDAGWARGW
jgi:hypothetical protein